MGKVQGVNVVVGIPSFGMVSTYFAQARQSMGFPLVSSSIDKYVLGKPIAEARNEIVEFALSQNANYIFWLDDDVIAPPDSFLKLFSHQKDIINGVYWSKSNPPMPLLFRGHLNGPYYDWHVGDLIEIDAAGSGLTLVRTDVYREMSKQLKGPWYSTDYTSFPGVVTDAVPPNNTEDLYFYWKAKSIGYRVWADTSVQAFHFEKNSKVMYYMPAGSPQANPAWEVKKKGSMLIADIGSGPVSPYFPEGEVVSFDIREDVRPDVVCDVRHLPVPNETFDMVYSAHVLEHFPWTGVDKILKEWVRTLKTGGELRLVVPNLRWSAKRILDDSMSPYDYWVLYGEQDYPKNFHAGGFTPNSLRSIVESMGCFENIEVREGDIDGPPGTESWNLMLKAKKVLHPVLDNIAPDDYDAAPPSSQMWPMAIFPEYRESPIGVSDPDLDIANTEAEAKKAGLLAEIRGDQG